MLKNSLFVGALFTIWLLFSGFLTFSERALTDSEKNATKRVGLFVELNNYMTFFESVGFSQYAKSFSIYSLRLNEIVPLEIKRLLEEEGIEVVMLPPTKETVMIMDVSGKEEQFSMVEKILSIYNIDTLMLVTQQNPITSGPGGLPDGFYLQNVFNDSTFSSRGMINILRKRQTAIEEVGMGVMSAGYISDEVVWDDDTRKLIPHNFDLHKEKFIENLLRSIKEKLQEINLITK